MRRWLTASPSEQIRFVIVGAWNTVFAYTVWAVLQLTLGDRLGYVAALLLAWPVAVANAYVCQRHFVFRSTGSIRRELPRFSVIYVVTLAGSLVLLPILLRTLPFNIYVIQGAFVALSVVATYTAHRLVTFRQPPITGPTHRGERGD